MRSGVTVPTHLAKGEVLTLKLSKLFRGSMELTREKVTADLLFDEQYFTCTVPLEAVWGATSEGGETVIWPESAPSTVIKSAKVAKPQPAAAKVEETPVAEPVEVSVSAPEPVLKKKGHLTRIK
jgi:stringent starvation protein B